MIAEYKLPRILTDEEGSQLEGKFLGEEYIKHPIINYDCDGYDMQGNMLFRFRKNVIPIELLKQGVDNFKHSVELTESRGKTSGYSGKRIRKDGTKSNITVGNKVYSGNVGYMNASPIMPYCRMTNFGRDHFDKFQAGIPFVQAIDKLYADLCPEHYKIQKMYAEGTNGSYVIADTSFTTITVNRSFRTACHKDSGDLEAGFGNLIAYREGNWEGSYFMLPEFGVGIDIQNGDALFVDVHRWHCNTDYKNFHPEKGDVRYSFVLYYREQMINCDSPSKELHKVKMDQNGFYRL